MTYDKVVSVKPLKLKKTVSLSDSDEDNKENDTICISPEKANITKGGFQQSIQFRRVSFSIGVILPIIRGSVNIVIKTYRSLKLGKKGGKGDTSEQ